MMVMYMCLDKTQSVVQTDTHCINFLTLNLTSVQVEKEFALFLT